MQFLIITRNTTPNPPEMTLPLIEAMQSWLAEHRASGQLLDAWSFAGTQGGEGLLEVSSHEELDEVVLGFPFAPFSDVQVIPLADLDVSLATSKALFSEAMAATQQ